MHNIVFGIFIAFLIICLVGLFCVILVKIYISKIKKYNEIIYQKEVNQQKAINQTIIETQENTLNALAGELHDDVGQQLTCINFQLENLKLIKPYLEEDIAPITKSLFDLDSSIRSLSHSIKDQKIKHHNLIDSIKKEIEKINKLNVMSCKLHIQPEFTYTFSTNERIVLFRIFQETLNNALKHSKAKTFSIIIEDSPTLNVTFEDDGVGFSLEKVLLKDTSGMENIKNRAELIDYSCDVRSKESKGTIIKLSKTLKE